MPIWSFIFTNESDKLQSARVAAPTTAKAWLMLRVFAGLPEKMPGVLKSFLGRDQGRTDAAVLSAIQRDGKQLIQ